MNHEEKQQWIEAVMADRDLSSATARYAYGIFKHMFGTKDESWPGAAGLEESTGLHHSKFFRYNQALEEAGYLDITRTAGKVNRYRLTRPTPTGSNTPSQKEGDPLPQGVTPPPIGGTNTTSKTTRKTSMKDNNKAAVVADAPTSPPTSNHQVRDGGTEGDIQSLLNLSATGGPNEEASNAPPPNGGGSTRKVVTKAEAVASWNHEQKIDTSALGVDDW